MQLNLIQLFPELLNLSGDRGNITVLTKRCRLRDISLSVEKVSLEEEFSLSEADFLYLGNGSEKDLPRITQKLLEKKADLLTFREKGGVILASGNTYPILGTLFSIGEKNFPGVGLLQMETHSSDTRMTGNVVVNTPFGILTGFENHMGKTRLGASVTPLGTLITGYGNNGEDRTEGAVYKNIFATYLTGPLLPNNPELADLLIEKALEHKSGTFRQLTPLPNELENLSKGYLLNYDNRTHKR